MNNHVKRLSDQARALPAADLADLLDDLLAALHEADPEVERAWSVESERRLDAFLRGETAAKSAEDVLAKRLGR